MRGFEGVLARWFAAETRGECMETPHSVELHSNVTRLQAADAALVDTMQKGQVCCSSIAMAIETAAKLARKMLDCAAASAGQRDACFLRSL